MPRVAVIAGVELRFPLVQKLQRSAGISDLVAQIVGDPAIRVYVAEVLAQSPRQEPRSDGKIFVM
jgi:hypothetical protein